MHPHLRGPNQKLYQFTEVSLFCYVTKTLLLKVITTYSLEPSLIPKLQDQFADFPNLRYSITRGCAPKRPDVEMSTDYLGCLCLTDFQGPTTIHECLKIIRHLSVSHTPSRRKVIPGHSSRYKEETTPHMQVAGISDRSEALPLTSSVGTGILASFPFEQRITPCDDFHIVLRTD